MKSKNTLVIGASDNPQRYSYLAINKLKAYGHFVMAIGKKQTKINDIEIIAHTPEFPNVNTVSLYLNPTNQIPYYNYILSLKPVRIIFNPGTENPELAKLAKEKGIETIEACTLVMLSTNQY
jgi:predicted CoA-binding protein